MSKTYKLGLCGVGRFGKNYIKTIEGMEDAEIVAISTSNPENAKLFNHKVIVFDHFSKLAQCGALHGVIIATPPNTHYQIMKNCVDNVLPFLVEKPMCGNINETLAASYLIKSSRIACMVGHTQLQNPAYRELVTMYDYDKAKTVLSQVCSVGPFRKDVSMLWDWLPHDFSMLLTLMREFPDKLKASYVKHENYDNSGEVEVELHWKKTKATIKLNNLATKKYRVFQVDSAVKRVTMFDNELFETRDNKIRQIHVKKEMPLRVQVENFILAMETNTQIGVDLAVKIAKLIEFCEKSIEQNSKLITVKEG